MTTMTQPPPVDQMMVAGIDTHRDSHTVALLTSDGKVLGVDQFPTTAAGYQHTLAWLTTEDPQTLALQLAPGLAWVCSAWPVASIWLAHTEGTPTLAQAGAQLRQFVRGREAPLVVPRDLLMRVLEPVTSEQYINSKHELLALMDEFARLNGAGSHE